MAVPRGSLLGLLLVVPTFAGCLADDPPEPAAQPASLRAALSEPLFPSLKGISVWIPASSDGTRLHMRLFLPDLRERPDWKAPTILVMSPYFGDDAREDPSDPSSEPTYFRYKWLIHHFVPRGYAVALADVRGTGDSGGCLEQTAQLQWQDGYDTVEWLASQRWSNGRVGMFGKSYDAETQQSTAVMAPPHLTTIVPVSSVSGQYEYSFYDGVPFTLQALGSNLFYMVDDGLQVPTSQEGRMQYPGRVGCHPAMSAQGLDMSGDWNAFWEEREIRNHVDQVRASVLYVHGLQDWNVKPVALRDWFNLIPSQKRAIFGQWSHDYPEENRFQANWSRPDWRPLVHRWYDHWLLGLDNGILDDLPPVQVQDSSGAWRGEDAYPPVDATGLTFHASPGTLSPSASKESEPLRLRENEEAFLARNSGFPIPSADSAPYADRLELASEPLPAPLHVSGWPVLNFTARMGDITTASPEADAHFAAVLFDVGPDGGEQWINRGYLSARHRAGVRSPQSVPTGVDLEFGLRFFPQDTVIPAGHRIKLVLEGSDDWTQPQGSFWSADITNAGLTLPVIERDWDAVRLPIPLGDPIKA